MRSALSVMGEAFGCTAVTVVRSLAPADTPNPPTDLRSGDPASSKMWSWSLPSWSGVDASAYELHGRLWSFIRHGPSGEAAGDDGPALISIESLFEGTAIFARLTPDGTVGAYAYRRADFSQAEATALWQAMAAVASVIQPGQSSAAARHGMAGPGLLSYAPRPSEAQRPDAAVDPVDPTLFLAKLRVGRTSVTAHGQTPLLAVARAAAHSHQPRADVVFAESIDVGNHTVTLVLMQLPHGDGNDAPRLRMGLAVRPLGDVNGGAVAVFSAVGWPEGHLDGWSERRQRVRSDQESRLGADGVVI